VLLSLVVNDELQKKLCNGLIIPIFSYPNRCITSFRACHRWSSCTIQRR